MWICRNPRVDLPKFSCGFTKILVWICRNPRVDLQKSSCGFAEVLVSIFSKPHESKPEAKFD